jgi:hypothetical protein
MRISDLVHRAMLGAVLLAAVLFAASQWPTAKPARAQLANPSTWYVGWATAPTTAAPLSSLLSPTPPGNLSSFQNGFFCYPAKANTGTVALGPSSSVTTSTGIPLTPSYVNVASLGVTSLGAVYAIGNGTDQVFCYGN